MVGETYYKDFTIWNRSEIDLVWTLNTVDLNTDGSKNKLEFTDYDTGESLDFAPITSFSPKRIRVMFRPKEIGEFNYELQIENENDSNNVRETRVHAIVRSVLREEVLIVNTGNFLEFSDCCAGVWKKKEMMLRNISDLPLEIKFHCDDPGVVFQLHLDDHFVPNHRPQRRSLKPDGSIESLNSGDNESFGERINDLSSIQRSNSNFSIGHESVSSRGSSPGPVADNISPESFERSDLEKQYERYLSNHHDYAILSEEGTRVDEIALKPGRERHIQVCYNPPKEDLSLDYRGGRLVKRTFKITLTYWHPRSNQLIERKSIQCTAKVCTSFIEVTPSVLNFGDTDGIKK